MANLQKATVFAIKEETTAGTPVVPSAGSDFIPLRAGFSMSPNLEDIPSDEISNNLGSTKSYVGKESPSGSHAIFLKHSETEGQAPEYGLIVESLLGDKSVASTEYDTVSSSTTSLIKVNTGEGATFETGEALLIKDGTNGYSIRNISSISSDDLSINFNLSSAPASGVNLGKAVLYKPATTGIPTFTSWMYRSSAAAIEMIAGCRTSNMTMTFPAGKQAEATFAYEGTAYYFNPIVITATNKYLDFTDDGGTTVAVLTPGVYKDPIQFAAHVQTVGQAAATASGGDNFFCTYSSTTGKFTISTTTGSLLSLLWNTGTNAANTVGTIMGFSTAADDTAALTYTSDNAISMAPTSASNIVTQSALTPSYDDADNIIVKSAELFIGDSTDNFCRKASTVSITIDSPSVDADSICSTTGLFEKVPSARTVTLTATIILSQYEAALFDKYINNTTTQVMLNVGPKSGGNWVAGKCVNVYFGNATVSGHALGGDDFVTVDLSVKGYITTTKQDVYINFV